MIIDVATSQYIVLKNNLKTSLFRLRYTPGSKTTDSKTAGTKTASANAIKKEQT